jgi:hypothetical protein
MSSHPEVAITIMTGGQHGAAESGPTPVPFEQLPAAGGASGFAGAPMPSDAVAFGAVDMSTSGAPTPLDLDELAAQAAPRRRSAAKKSTAKKSTAKRGGR